MRSKTEIDVTILNTSVEQKRKGTDIKQGNGDKQEKEARQFMRNEALILGKQR